MVTVDENFEESDMRHALSLMPDTSAIKVFIGEHEPQKGFEVLVVSSPPVAIHAELVVDANDEDVARDEVWNFLEEKFPEYFDANDDDDDEEVE